MQFTLNIFSVFRVSMKYETPRFAESSYYVWDSAVPSEKVCSSISPPMLKFKTGRPHARSVSVLNSLIPK